MNKSRKYYLAASYYDKDEAREIANEIDSQSNWKCNSRWLGGGFDSSSPEGAALVDLEDLNEADVIVVLHGKSSEGGMWVELGIALESGKSVIVMIKDCVKTQLPIFAFLSQVYRYTIPEQDLISVLCVALDNHGIPRQHTSFTEKDTILNEVQKEIDK